ncbi:hypothetical protein DPMN_013112 [Dreissena polymorpha]|uniref:Uncharacterized protein n=1 Tax=Dreissena polymorpha TaxID=45954 RepID=A0A9D4S1J6_DREPO|nr:hypothetical protein DPMN_013112 [Dreissena polymorpha]
MKSKFYINLTYPESDKLREPTTSPASQFQRYIIGTNLLTKFNEDRKINVASRVLTRKNAPTPWQPCFPDIIGMNLLTKFHEDLTVNVASRVLTRFNYGHIRKNAPPLGSHIFQANIVIFKLIQDMIETNLLTKFHEDWTINVASRKKCPASGGHVFEATKTIFKLIQDIIRTNLLIKLHDDRKINVTSRVFTRKNAPPRGCHDFQPTGIIFELVQDIIRMNLLTEFHEDRTINKASRVKNCPASGGNVLKATKTIFELIQDINKTYILTMFHEQWTIHVASRVLTMFYYSHIRLNLRTKFHEDQTKNVASRVKNAPPLGSHDFQENVTIFELIQDILETNLLTLTRQMLTAHDERRTTDKKRSQKLSMSTLCSIKVPVPRDFFGYVWNNRMSTKRRFG